MYLMLYVQHTEHRTDFKEKSKSNKKMHSQVYEVFTNLLDSRENALSS